MFRKILIGAFVTAAVFSQVIPSLIQKMVGGFEEVNEEDLAKLQNDQVFNQAQALARESYSNERGGELGTLIAVSRQIVSGINYRMIFQTADGDFEVTVYIQPWTDTKEILDMKPLTVRD